ncbi:Uncharacterized protein BM_BM14144 [Brugia malayi]|uniref:Bm14144 n=1 Tax=Brugia malayi TaxID=6279 RepID=A0A0J9YAF7_BRUMA|nr:Uncharacterized protein BM_BM14144 [Brugia malayi]CDQ05389.1 Bm14144 [Brugia malayi]VIO97589.1 Uncharacterized protein BM_BM14144 [Brugia malayi]
MPITGCIHTHTHTYIHIHTHTHTHIHTNIRTYTQTDTCNHIKLFGISLLIGIKGKGRF